MDICIRPAQEADFPQLLKLFQDFADFVKVPEKMTNTLEQMQADKEYFKGYLAEDGEGNIIGFATYFPCYYTWSGKAMYLDDLYVKPEYRDKGIGTALMQKIISVAKESGCRKLRWQVSNWNSAAIAFYKSLGAEIDAIEQNCNLEFSST
jgi:GNAT superfamily N-acetyltransferase